MLLALKNENEINEDNMSKSLSKIDPNNSIEDKNQLSISESNDIFNYPTPKKMLSEVNQLSKRMREEEYEIEFNNMAKIGELRTKYFSNKSYFKDKKNYFNISNKDKINIRLKSINMDKFNQFKNKIINKKILKSNVNLKYDNNIDNDNEINNNNINVFDFSKKNNYFNELLNEDFNYMDNIKQITKNDLLKIKNDKEKIIILLDKNEETITILRKIEEKYKILKNEYIELYKNIILEKNNNFKNNLDSNEFEKYIMKQNENMNKKIEIFQKYFLPMANYIDDISKIFKLHKINFLEIKQNINKLESKSIQENFNNILDENIKSIKKIMKENILLTNNYKFNFKILNKKGRRIFK